MEPPRDQGLDQPGAPPAPAAEALSSGTYAAQLIQKQTRRLGRLQPEVLADTDPEPLHQLRVSLRRLRTAIQQFTPALLLPEGVSEGRIARVARRTGLCRNLDVLHQRLESTLLPALPAREAKALRPALRQLARDRGRAFEALVEALGSGRYLKLLERLHLWQQRPRFTPLGELPLLTWLDEWQAPLLAGLFLQPGWFATDPRASSLHELRKRIKATRYGLENLQPLAGSGLQASILDLKHAQEILGDLHDLQVLSEALADALGGDLVERLPELHRLIGTQEAERWQEWQALSGTLRADGHRQTVWRVLLRPAADMKKPAGEAGEDQTNR